MVYTKLKNINEYVSESINPMKSPDTVFEMYSVPVFNTGHPEYLRGEEIGSSKVVVYKNDILLCKINPRINRVWVVSDESEYLNIASSEWIVVRSSTYNPEYLAWYFRCPMFKKLMTSEVTGIGGSLTRAQPKAVAEYPIPQLPREEQDHVVSVLNKLNTVIIARKRELKTLDELIKARFVEMLNDASETIRLDKLIEPYRAEKCGNIAYPVLSITMHNGLVLQSERFKKQIASTDKSNYKVVPRDKLVVAFPIDEGLLSVQTIVDTGIVSPAYSLYSIHEDLIIPKVLEYILRSDLSIQYYKSKLRGTTLRRRMIPKSDFDSMPIQLPSLSRQKQFINEISQIDKSKVVVQKALDEAQLLFDSLMQEYFG